MSAVNDDDDVFKSFQLFSQFNQEQRTVVSTENTDDLIDNETKYLQELNMRDISSGDYLRDILTLDRFHSCSETCNWVFLKENDPFVYGGTRCRATGKVYVCKTSNKVHLCGSSYCNQYSINTKEMEMVCQWTGVVFAERAKSLARTREDANIVLLGGITFNEYTPMGSSEETRGSLENAEDEEYEELGDGSQTASRDRYLKKLMTIDERKGLIREKYKMDIQSMDEIFTKLLSRAYDGEREVLHMLQLYGGNPVEFIVEKLHERHTWRQYILGMWNIHVATDDHMKRLHQNANVASEKWLKRYVINYYVGCLREGLRPDIAHILQTWLKRVDPYYSSIYYGGDIDKVNSIIRKNCIESILRIWEKVKSLDCVISSSKIRFDTCCAAVLNHMKSGYRKKVYTVGDDPKPHLISSLPRSTDKKITCHDIEFIEPFPHILLIEIKDARHLAQKPTKRKKKMLKRQCGRGGFYQNKPKTSYYQTNSSKTNNVQTHIIPALKYWNFIFSYVVENSKTLDDLKEYCTSYICNSYIF